MEAQAQQIAERLRSADRVGVYCHIDADGITHLSERLLAMHDGPFLEQGLKVMAGHRLIPPGRPEDCPDKQRLDLRFQAFRRVA